MSFSTTRTAETVEMMNRFEKAHSEYMKDRRNVVKYITEKFKLVKRACEAAGGVIYDTKYSWVNEWIYSNGNFTDYHEGVFYFDDDYSISVEELEDIYNLVYVEVATAKAMKAIKERKELESKLAMTEVLAEEYRKKLEESR